MNIYDEKERYYWIMFFGHLIIMFYSFFVALWFAPTFYPVYFFNDADLCLKRIYASEEIIEHCHLFYRFLLGFQVFIIVDYVWYRIWRGIVRLFVSESAKTELNMEW
jgi:hypothetical protein